MLVRPTWATGPGPSVPPAEVAEATISTLDCLPTALPRSHPPSDSQITSEGGGQPGPAELLQPTPYPAEELGAPYLAECPGARLRRQAGEVIIGAVADLKGVAPDGGDGDGGDQRGWQNSCW